MQLSSDQQVRLRWHLKSNSRRPGVNQMVNLRLIPAVSHRVITCLPSLQQVFRRLPTQLDVSSSQTCPWVASGRRGICFFASALPKLSNPKMRAVGNDAIAAIDSFAACSSKSSCREETSTSGSSETLLRRSNEAMQATRPVNALRAPSSCKGISHAARREGIASQHAHADHVIGLHLLHVM